MKYNTALQEEKFVMIRRWEESGLSQRKFTQQENIAPNNFYYWLKKYRDQKQGKIASAGRKIGKENTARFIKIPVPKKLIDNSFCVSEVVFANGNRIKFYNAVEISQLKQLAH
jgi:predicted transcriptional regulator